MFRKNIQDLQEDDIEEFFNRRIPESKTLEYKSILKYTQEEDKKEFLADITSFANAVGGYILYGIEAIDGVPEKMEGVEIENLDKEKLRLESIVRDNIRPKIDFSFTEVKLKNDNYILIINVRESFNSPHGIISNKHYKFFSRGEAGKFELDIDQLRDTFLRSSSLVEKIRDFRLDRIIKIESGKSPVDIFGESQVVVHIIPRESFTSKLNISLDQIKNLCVRKDNSSTLDELIRPLYQDGGWNNIKPTLDGFISKGTRLYSIDKEKEEKYTLIFRNGIIESVESILLSKQTIEDYGISTYIIEKSTIDFIERSLKALKLLEINPPFYIFISLMNIRGKDMWVANNKKSDKFRQNNLILQEVIVDGFGLNIANILKNTFDLIYNAVGLEGTPNIDKDGNWKD